MKKLENLEKVVLEPNLDFYGAFTWDGEDIFLCDDCEETKAGGIRITQRIEGGKLISHIRKHYCMLKDKKVVKDIYQETELQEGQMLVYVRDNGFVIPEYQMCSIDEAIDHYELLKQVRA